MSSDREYSGYFIDRFYCTKPQLDYIEEITKDVDQDTARFFKHVLASTCIQKYKSGWIPVYSGLIKQEAPKSNWRTLQQAGLIEVKLSRHSKEGKSNEYLIPEAILEKFGELALPEFTDTAEVAFIVSPKYNLMNGKPAKSSVQKPAKYGKDKKKEPVIILKAMECIPYGMYNSVAIRFYLKQFKASIPQIVDPEKRKKANRKYLNDYWTYLNVVKQGRESTEWSGIFKFPQNWKGTSTGRITGGFQSASRQMKAYIYHGIPGVRNYDIYQSQVSLLLHQIRTYAFYKMANYGFAKQTKVSISDADWLLKAWFNKELRKQYADEVGISEDSFKSCVYGIIFGADPNWEESEVIDHLRDELNDNEEAIEAARLKLVEVCKPLLDLLRKWHSELLRQCRTEGEYPQRFTVRKSGIRSAKKGRITYVTNSCGKVLTLEKYGVRKRKRKLASHILQGNESAFIHTLTRILVEEYGRTIISNEHDGLIVLGDIPQEAVLDAQERSIEYPIDREPDLIPGKIRIIEEKPFLPVELSCVAR